MQNISIVLDNITIERLHSIDEEREKTMQDTDFINWCKQMNIGARVEIKNHKAEELMQQYPEYPKWVQRMF